MSVRQENRYRKLVIEQGRKAVRPAEFQMMEDLSALPKYEDAGTPFGPIRFAHGNGGWWAECPKTGFGYWYKTLHEAVRRWRVTIVGYDGQHWLATPNT